MIGQLLIVLREGFEAALIISIIMAYIIKTGKSHLTRYVWYGVIASISISFFLGASIWIYYGTLSEATQVLFEGLAAWLAVGVLSSMVYWMATKGKEIKIDIERRVAEATTRGTLFGFFTLSFILVFREGLETVLFLTPFLLSDTIGTIIGSVIGGVIAISLSYLIFVIGININIRRFFYFTSILLILLAGGLAGYGTHELIEYAEISNIDLAWLSEYAYKLPIDTDNPLHHKNIIGSILAVMFGYTVKAEWGRLLIHLLYLSISIPAVVYVYRKQ